MLTNFCFVPFSKDMAELEKYFVDFFFAYISVNIFGTSRNCFRSICQPFLTVYIRCREHYTAKMWCDKNKIRDMDGKDRLWNLQGRAFCWYGKYSSKTQCHDPCARQQVLTLN
jgi:hypothetical protein